MDKWKGKDEWEKIDKWKKRDQLEEIDKQGKWINGRRWVSMDRF